MRRQPLYETRILYNSHGKGTSVTVRDFRHCTRLQNTISVTGHWRILSYPDFWVLNLPVSSRILIFLFTCKFPPLYFFIYLSDPYSWVIYSPVSSRLLRSKPEDCEFSRLKYSSAVGETHCQQLLHVCISILRIILAQITGSFYYSLIRLFIFIIPSHSVIDIHA